MTSAIAKIVSTFHRQGNCILSAAIRWTDFGDRPSFGRPFVEILRHSDTPFLSVFTRSSISPPYAKAGLGRRSPIRLRIFRNSSLGTTIMRIIKRLDPALRRSATFDILDNFSSPFLQDPDARSSYRAWAVIRALPLPLCYSVRPWSLYRIESRRFITTKETIDSDGLSLDIQSRPPMPAPQCVIELANTSRQSASRSATVL